MRVGSLAPAALLVGIGVGIGMLISTRNEGASSAAASAEGDRVALKARIKVLEQTLAAARRSLTARTATPTAAPTEKVDEADGAPEVDPEEARRRSERRIAHIQAVFEADPVDRSWASPAEIQFAESVGSDALRGSTLLALECRTRLCRAEVDHGTEADFDVFARDLPTLLQGMPRTTMKRLPTTDGRGRTILYAAREGYRMPVPP